MMHSPTCEHALRALIYMASRPQDGPILVREIAEASGVSRQSLAKILHGLRRKGLVRSTKGPGGGYALDRPPGEMKLMEIIEAVDGPLVPQDTCVLGLDMCDDDASCALHDYWKQFRQQYFGAVSMMSLLDAAKAVARKKHGLSGIVSDRP